MSKLIVSIIISLLFTLAIQANSLEIGQKFPLEKLKQTAIAADNTIVVFIPSLTEDCEYASMLTQSFYFYFDQKLAFEKLQKIPTVNVVFVVNDRINAAKSTQNILGKMNVIYDEKGELFDEFGISKPTSKNLDSTAVLLDSSEKIALIDKNYRSQGEHLKPLENKLRELNGIKLNVSMPTRKKELKIGDVAPDFRIRENEMLSDLRGKVVLVSFYPAAFSGVLPKPFDLKVLSAPGSLSFSKADLMSCAIQIEKLDLKTPADDAKRIVVSSSTPSILENWQNALKTNNVFYANDTDYSTSLKYGSYNALGYNNRVSIIVDRRGKIAYIDKSFERDDEKVLNAKLNELLKRK
jgi:peroxiredoxin